ncbi:MAG: ABC-F family ATP-binding cassette domain-containing protein [Deltaproteobacteria bacterium]|nr:ABC-F family ATP-binding cassette domain-containing protein [Deltaproteobacteria bacterium]
MISFNNVTKQYGAQVLFVDASFQLNPGEKVGLVGPNGSGKTTVFRLVMGEEGSDDGSVQKPRRLTVGYFRQDVGEMRGRSVLAETVAGAGEVADLGAELNRLEARMAEAGDDLERAVERFGEVQARFQELGGYEIEARAQSILAGLGLRLGQVQDDVGKLSGGWKMRVALARILLARPDVLLLDEPTNYLDIESILWLESFLRDYPGAVLMTCHDRDVMNRVARKIIEIDGGQVRSYTGDFDFYERARALEAAQREAEYQRQQAMLAREMRFVERFKAQVAKAPQVQSRLKRLEKIERIEPPRRIVERHFDFRKAPRSGDDVVKIEAVRKAWGEHVVHDGLSLLVRRGERWAVMGENGAGKTTLLKMIVGALPPDSGQITLGAGVTLGYFAQHQMEQLDAGSTVLEELDRHARTAPIGVIKNLAAAFGFSGDDVDKPVRVLSGGERARVALAKILYDAPNLLVLDEPTNHLDMTTKRALVRALETHEGTMVFVSHDRAFLRVLAGRVLELGAGAPRVYPGRYDEYVAATGREAPGMRR